MGNIRCHAFALLVSLKKGKTAVANPWDGATLEWTIPSPPPLHNFIDEPQVKEYPYDYRDIIPQKND